MTALRIGKIKWKGKHSVARILPNKATRKTLELMASVAASDRQRALSPGRSE